VREFRRTFYQRPEITLRAANREILQDISTGIHNGHHDPGQVLTQRERTGHGYKGDGVNSQSARQEIADDRDE
jgi:hypothetical protein